MDKNDKKVNRLIKRKGFIELVREKGINRISKRAEKLVNFLFIDYLNKTLNELKVEMEISGKRVLDEEVVENFLKYRDKKEDFDY